LIPRSENPIRSRWLAAAALLVLAGCRSAEDWRDDADRQAYALVQSRREKLALDTGGFTIEPEKDSLREQLIAGETHFEKPLTLVDCLRIAAENSREYQRQKESLYLAALDLTLERWRFAIQTGGTLNALVDGQGDEAQTASGGGNFTLGKLLGTGATILGSLGLNVTRSLIGSDGWHPTSDLSLAVTQPLLAGFGERIVKEPLTQAERNLVYQVRTFERFRRTFAFDVATRYYRILQTQDAVTNQENDVAHLTELSKRNMALAEAGRLSVIELGQARQNELRSQNDLLAARQRLDQSLDLFKLFLGLPPQSPLPIDQSALAEIEAQKDARIDFPEDLVTGFALQHRLDLMTAQDQVDDADRKAYVAADALRAFMSVHGAASIQSQDGKPLKYDFRDLSWAVGANVTLPFERLPQRNTYREALISEAASMRARGLAEDQIRADLRDDLRQAANRRDSYTIQQDAAELAQKRIDSTTLNMEAGRADTRDLLEAQESLLTAQNAVTSALIDYTLARLNLFLDMELLTLDQDGIHVKPELLDAPETGPIPGVRPEELGKP
jgi:outer membrane protein TolC